MRRKKEIFIEPPHLRWADIREEAEKFRQRYVSPPETIPVPIIEIVECALDLEPIPIPGLMSLDIDGFLTSDLKKICIDADIYQNPRKETRLRFTLAHEVGHLILHREEIRRCAFRNTIDWIHFREDFSEEGLNWFEQQAYEFAGRLLVPRPALMAEIKSIEPKIRRFRSLVGDEKATLDDAVARIICPKFAVSPGVIVRRIRSEKIRL